MEGGNRDEEDRLGPASPLFSSHPPPSSTRQHYRDDYMDNSHRSPINPAPLDHSFHHRRHPAEASFAFQTGFAADHASAGASDEPPLDPDDFYRSFRQSEPPHSSSTATVALRQDDPMASALPTPRQPPVSLRSNSNGTTPKHPTVPAGRNGLRPGYRPASNAADDKSVSGITRSSQTAPNGGGQSVKDLKKKFDQSPSQIPTTPRKIQPRNGPKDVSNNTRGRVVAPGGGIQTPSSAGRAPSTRQPNVISGQGTPTSQGTSRTKPPAENPPSETSQSFASRVSRPGIPLSGHAQVSKSMTHLPETRSSPSRARSNALLFGEILPEENDASTTGYGIDGIPERETSESDLQSSGRLHQRSLSDAADLEPSSPTDWYRAAAPVIGEVSGQGQPQPRQPTSHHRAHSDVAGAKTPHQHSQERAIRRSNDLSFLPQPSYRLPLSVKKLSTSSDTSSPASTRSSSPSSTKRPPISGRTSRQHGPPHTATRTRTPTYHSAVPISASKTPGQAAATSTRKPAPQGLTTSSNNNRLNAYISAPPPKLSPPLRSSRPRQPVSKATTTSSRMKMVERNRSPNPGGMRPESKQEDAPGRRRKISVGPIDFAQRRETIKLAYSKSIRDSQAIEARRAAAEQRKNELETAKARAQTQAAARAKAQVQLTAKPEEMTTATADVTADVVSQETKIGEDSPTIKLVDEDEKEAVGSPLKITTSIPILISPDVHTHKQVDSPTLSMIPGSFPSLESPEVEQEDIPQSAVSATTVTTEFDAEPQTEPPVQEQPVDVHNEGDDAKIAPLPYLEPIHERATYHSPFDDQDTNDGSVSIKISLDTSSPVRQSTQDLALTDPEGEPSIPGSYRDEYEILEQEHLEPDFEPPFAPQYSLRDSHDGQLDLVEENYAPAYILGHQGIEETQHDPELDQAFEPHAPLNQELDSEPEYEPQPFIPSSHQTTVTIVSREPDFTPRSQRPEVETKPYSETATSDIRCSGESQQPELFEGLYAGRVTRQRFPALRESIASSDGDLYERHRQTVDLQQIPGTSHNLHIPPMSLGTNRTSQQSAWTDFSVDSGGTRDEEQGPRGRPSMRPDEARSISSFRERSSLSIRDSRDPSLCGSRTSMSQTRHRLLDLDIDGGFSVPYPGSHTPSDRIPMPPNHGPPPIPLPEEPSLHDGRQTPASSYYDQTRPNSYHQSVMDDQYSASYGRSRRESEDIVHSVTRPGSTDQTSFITNDYSTGDRTLVDSQKPSESGDLEPDKVETSSRDKNRLTQRLNVIKELIDTEAIFVRDMSIVEEIYKGTAEACPNLDSNTIKLIFRNTTEIIAFHTTFVAQLKEGVLSVYAPKLRRPGLDGKDESTLSDGATINSMSTSKTTRVEPDDTKDRQTSIGQVFTKNLESMKDVHEAFLRTSDLAAKRLIQIQEDPTVQVWLNECNEVAKDLTAAWNLDSLLIKPMQRITKYPNLIIQLLQYTPDDHPDRESLISARTELENAILEINKTKKNFELVGQIVGRKRKESDVRAGFARAFGKRVDKLQASTNRPPEDPEYHKLHEKFGDDYLRLQVVLRDVEYYTRQVSAYVHEFLQYLSSMELVMRLQPSPYPEIESKWTRFNVSMRDIEKVALEQHLAQVRKDVIEPFEHVIRCYSNPSLAMKKRAKRRVDYEKSMQLKKGGKKLDKQLAEAVEQYEALNETLKKELPKLSALTERIGNICLGNFVNIQAKWFSIWKEKVRFVLDNPQVPEVVDIIPSFQRDFRELEDHIGNLSILNPASKGRSSQSTTDDALSMSRSRSRPSDLSVRPRGSSVNGDSIPSLPTPDFAKRNSGHFAISPSTVAPSPHQYYYRDYYPAINTQSRNTAGSASPITPELTSSSRSAAGVSLARPSTGRSYDSTALPRQSTESATQPQVLHSRRDSVSTYNTNLPPPDSYRFSGLFHSALPPQDDAEESYRSSRASSRERNPRSTYRVMWLAASLFEFNIETTKHEAGYPYLTYQAGEIFDVIAEKGELWLAKNQDDPNDLVGWIWSKHFAKLADS